MSKPCHSQEHPAYVCRTEGNRTGKKERAGGDRHDFGDKERSNKADLQQDKMTWAIALTGVIPMTGCIHITISGVSV